MARIARKSPPLLGTRPQLEVRELEVVVALADAGTTVGGAAALHVTQSAVSRALTQAEDRLGVRLFERGARGLAPTHAGARLITGARQLLSELRELERVVTNPVAQPTRVRLVCECYTAYRWLPSTIATLGARLPGVEVDIAMEHTNDPVRALFERQIDIALLTTSALPRSSRRAAELVERPLFSDEIVFLVAASHPLASARAITRADLRAHCLITSNAPVAEKRWFMKSVFGRRPPRLTRLLLPLTEAIADAARAGMGVAVLSEWMASAYVSAGDLVVKRLASGPLTRPWRIAYHREVKGIVEPLTLALTSAAPQLRDARPRLRSVEGRSR